MTGQYSGQDDFMLSPSEQRAHDFAVKTSGKKKPSTQKSLASIVLGFEFFVVFLVGLTLFGMQVLDPAWLGIAIGGVVCVVIIAALGLMRAGNIGIIIGWGVHALYFVGAFLLPQILFIGIIFTSLWVYCLWKGAQIDRTRAGMMNEEPSST